MSASLADVIVCSFYTDDDYYRGWARKLEANLDDLGVPHVLREVRVEPGQDWADVCRKKVAFLDEVCRENPGKRVFWTDVDCEILAFPEYLHSFTADIIGFQHGFSRPMQIGYAARPRFWAPSFLGINTTPAARAFVADAARFERESTLKATDDYFFEESWRVNADLLSFQLLPTGAVLGRGDSRVQAFFKFGSSGNVPEFRGKVAQHTIPGAQKTSARTTSRERLITDARRRVFDALKSTEHLIRRIHPRIADGLRDRAKQSVAIDRIRPTSPQGSASGTRARLLAQAVTAGQQGRSADLTQLELRLGELGTITQKEKETLHAAAAFAEYASRGTTGAEAIPVAWWPRPFPGNFGDWLSPYVISGVSGHPVRFVRATGTTRKRHLFAVGSIARFINDQSVVVGTGASAASASMSRAAAYHSLRGPLTAGILREQGGPAVESFGDPGVLLRRLIPIERGETNGRLLLVRHFGHTQLPLVLPEDMDEAQVFAPGGQDIADFVAKLAPYDGVVTSAMHVAIACHSYGIPVALIGFEGFQESIAGTGMKYRDYSLGAALDQIWEPTLGRLDLRNEDWRSRLGREYVSDAKLDEVTAAIHAAVADLLP